MKRLLAEIAKCQLCQAHLPHGIRPVLAADAESKIVMIGQAPGRIVHETGLAWDDLSGDRLRSWLGVDKQSFYNPKHFALIPMGFCYPGKGKTGDLPPRKECAPAWHQKLWDAMQEVQLTILIGSYAQKYYLGKMRKKTLTETLKHYKDYAPNFFVLPHPSPRNNIWLKKNPWFEKELVPVLQKRVGDLLVY
jgi:uracil-DNA glycosylase